MIVRQRRSGTVRGILAVGAIAVAALGIGACGGDDETTTVTTPSTPSVPSTTSTTTSTTSTSTSTTTATDGTTESGLPSDIDEARDQILSELDAAFDQGQFNLTQAQFQCIRDEAEQLLTDEQITELQGLSEQQAQEEAFQIGMDAGEACQGV
jgi:maltose-binding protein MalE